MAEYKCSFCTAGDTLLNLMDQINKIAQINDISKHDVITLQLIDEIRKMRIAIEGKGGIQGERTRLQKT